MPDSINYGISATHVSAQNLAVGQSARVDVSTEASPLAAVLGALLAAINAFEGALETRQLLATAGADIANALRQPELDKPHLASTLSRIARAAGSASAIANAATSVAAATVYDEVRQLAPGDLFGGYLIESLAGHGGMGLVYRARQLRPERMVAVKVIMPERASDSAFRARFEQEASLAAQIEHPNVIPIYGVGNEDGLLYIAMRFVDGSDLGVLLRARERIAPAHAAQLVSQIAAALDAAHGSGLVHRDVKPANVLVTGAHPNEHLYLTDFGLTKRVTDVGGVTATGGFVGTLDYIAPEQVSSNPVDSRSDIYSLGCVLYHLLTGTVPFPGQGEAAKIYAHLTLPAPRASQTVAAVPRAVDEVILRAMAKNPADRFKSAGDLAHAAIAATHSAT